MTLAPRLAALAVLLAACGPGELPPPPDEEPRETPPAAEASPPPAPSQGFVQRDVCPFECCVYGEWRALAAIPVYAAEGDSSRVAFELAEGDRFRAVTGNVHLSPTGLAVAVDTVEVETPGAEAVRFLPGDTVEILAPVGEGFYHVRVDGRVMEAPGFWLMTRPGADRPMGRVVREPRTSWWARVEDPRGAGWIAMDAHGGEIGGVDACGGPEPA